MKSDADILAESREYIETNGWWRHALIGPNGKQACGMGAVAASQGWLSKDVHGKPTIPARHTLAISRVLGKVLSAAYGRELGGKHVGLFESGFTNWNDNIVEGKQQVLDAFAKAEKIERAGFDPDA